MNSGTIKWITRLLIVPLFLCAWTFELDIGEAKIADTTLKNLSLQAATENFQQWSLKTTADSLHYQQKILKKISGQTRAHLKNNHIFFAPTILTALLGTEKIIFEMEDWSLNDIVYNMTPSFPLNLQLHDAARAFKIKTHWQPQHLDITLETDITALKPWLALFGINFAATSDAANLQLTLDEHKNHWAISGKIAIERVNWQHDQRKSLKNLDLNLQFTATGRGAQWQGNFSGALNQGAIRYQRFAFQASAPVVFKSAWQYDGKQLALTDAQIRDRSFIVNADAVFDGKTAQPQHIHLKQMSADAGFFYENYLKSSLKNTLFDDGKASGSFFISALWQKEQGLQQFAAVMNQLSIRDRKNRYQINKIDGQFGRGDISTLRIGNSFWRDLPIGASQVQFRWTQEGVLLVNEWRIPILDGALLVRALSPQKEGGYRLNFFIEPIDLQKFSTAVDLPPFEGNISGDFPNVMLSPAGMDLSEPVYLNIFDGMVEIKDLHLHRLFSKRPELTFHVQIDRLDLGRLTRAFRLAVVDGRIAGEINHVLLINWRPQRFQATITTDHNLTGLRRISHEAVQYITRAGGSSLVIGQFIRVLNSFPYEKLGIQAQLAGDILTINGVEKAESGGFYLLKGRGIPRLDIIGHQHRISWSELLNRLKAARDSDGPVMQ